MKKRSADSPVRASRKHFVLTEIEKLDGFHSGLATCVRTWLDLKVPAKEIAPRLEQQYGIPISASMVDSFRKKRWVVEKKRAAERSATMDAIKAFGGDAGLDAELLAKLWELMDKMTIPQLIQVRTLFLKIRAQNLKEQEFLYKTGQLKFGAAADGPAADPQEQQRGVLRRIKEIFGLATDEDALPALPAPPPEQPALPAATGQESA